MSETAYDLVVIGGNAGGLSVAVSAIKSGLRKVRVIEDGSAVAFFELVSEYQLDVGYGEEVTAIDATGDVVKVTTTKQSYTAGACVVAQRVNPVAWTPPPPTVLTDRIVVDHIAGTGEDEDILVIGPTDHAVELTARLTAAGARVVLAAGGMDPTRLSRAAESMLRRLEKERRATVLYRSTPDQVSEVDGYPMAFFNERRTPDLQFDHVVFASGRSALSPEDAGLTPAAAASGRVWFQAEVDDPSNEVPTLSERSIAQRLGELFPELTIPEPRSSAERRRNFTSVIEDLREEHYNATITYFEPTHSDLWVLRVRPDHGDVSHLPGQYASLGLGYWEERIDDAEDPNLDKQWEKLVRRSYSISHRIFDEHGYLAGERGVDELEFYIVLVPPTDGNVPGLTPRLALKRPGDRIYLGPKVAGRYTLDPVTDPNGTVLFFSTGTGEAPQNAMIVDLLRKGHRGPIVSAVSVRQMEDLGYLDKHRELESRYPNFHYLPMPTREPGVPKRYIQDVIRDGVLESEYGIALDPEHTHVFLCGNPAMIGLPTEEEGKPSVYPEVTGVVELLAAKGFTLDHRKTRGNIHFEEYW